MKAFGKKLWENLDLFFDEQNRQIIIHSNKVKPMWYITVFDTKLLANQVAVAPRSLYHVLSGGFWGRRPPDLSKSFKVKPLWYISE